MKNKKGFTLVELLAVIAILAILILIALPNIMSLFNEAKKNSFTTELKNIASAAESQWISDSMFETDEKVYSRCNSTSCNNLLKLSGRKELEFFIKLNKNGKIVDYKASDGTYQYSYNGTGLNVEDIDNVSQISELDSGSVITISAVAASTSSNNAATFITRQSPTTLTPGDEVTIANENFYIMTSDSSETKLLAKYSLDAVANKQVSTGQTEVEYANIGFWDKCAYSITTWECTTSLSGINTANVTNGTSYCSNNNGTNCAYAFNSSSNIYDSVMAYASKLTTDTGTTFTGRLITVEEARTFKNANSASAEAVKDKNNSKYWTGNPNTFERFYTVDTVAFIGKSYFYDTYGARPVLIVSTSDIQWNN